MMNIERDESEEIEVIAKAGQKVDLKSLKKIGRASSRIKRETKPTNSWEFWGDQSKFKWNLSFNTDFENIEIILGYF